MPHFRPVFTLLAVISTVGVQFSTLSAQTKITIGYAAVSPENHPTIHCPGTGNFREVWPRCEDCALSRRADISGEPYFRRDGSRLYRWHVGGGRRGAG